MIQPMPSAGQSGSAEDGLVAIVEELTTRLQAGEQVDLEPYIRAHPEHAERLRNLVPALGMLAELGQAPLPAAAPETPAPSLLGELGDFRILREVGRGGMGVVYEAEQISLGRRVALKVLPFAAALDARQLQRFKNEAQAAAGLHHTNIVPVYAVGCERGVHFYAMQYIEGQTLADLIQDLRRSPEAAAPTGPYTPARGVAAAADTPGPAAVARTTESSAREPAYLRKVAQLGIEAAEALEHAHQLGVIHRDIKPANLLVDGRGHLWVTDFGLAQVQSQAGLTLTGDLVGTLRYMSPEQALAQRVLIDHRTDVYSLGATLYELLTLEPAFPGSDREELLRQIAFEEARLPRRLNRAIPAELQTIVLKALEKNPDERYATAQEMADDLGRFLRDEPIRARRPTVVQRLRKWSRRHKAVTAGLVIGFLIAMVVGAVLGFWRQRRLAETDRGVTAALIQAKTLLDAGDQEIEQPEHWQATARLAQSALEKAEELLAAGVATDELSSRVQQVRVAVDAAVAESQLLVELDRIQSMQAGVYGFAPSAPSDNVDRDLDRMPLEQLAGREEQVCSAYRKALAGYGVDLAAPDEAAARVRNSRVRQALLASLEDWSRATRDAGERQRLDHVIQAADPADGFVAQWRAAARRRDGATLLRLAQDPAAERLPPTAVRLLAFDLKSAGNVAGAFRLLRQGQARHPDDFLLNANLASVLWWVNPGQQRESERYWMAALALRPRSFGPHYHIGSLLMQRGDLDGAIFEFRAALAIDPGYDPGFGYAHNGLGYALKAKGDGEGAIREFGACIQSEPRIWGAYESYVEVARSLKANGRGEAAIREFHEALRTGKSPALAHRRLAMVHNKVGNTLHEKRQLDGAITEYREAVRLQPDNPDYQHNLNSTLDARGQLDARIAELGKVLHARQEERDRLLKVPAESADSEEVLRLNDELGHDRYNLANALQDKGKVDEAIVEYQKAIGLNPDFPLAHLKLGMAFQTQQRWVEALAACKRSHELGSRQPDWPWPTGDRVRQLERLIVLDAKLPKILRGEAQPASAGEAAELAYFCQLHKGLYATATRFYREAFDTEPALAEKYDTDASRYNAACAAALAGCGQGKDANQTGAEGRHCLRNQALEWLRADLEAWRGWWEKEGEKADPVMQKGMRQWLVNQMQHWLEDTDFAGVRGDPALARLPTAERTEWQKLWQEVEALRQRAAASANKAAAPRR